MADISRLSRLVAGVQRGVDLSSNTLVVGALKIGATSLTEAILGRLLSLQDGSDVGSGYHTHDTLYTRTADVASTANGKGASLVGIEDAAGIYTATQVEAALAEVKDEADALVTLSGRSAGSTDLGTFTGSTIPDAATIKSALQSLETTIEALPSPFTYKGTWAASTNTPALDNTDTGKNGYVYYVTDSASVDFGAGAMAFNPGDKVANNGTTWDKWDMTDAVTSVNTKSGDVVLNTDDISESGSPTNLWFTDTRARTAAVVNSTSGSETDQAASVSAMKSYVTTAIGGVSAESLVRAMPAGEALSSSTLYAVRLGRPADSETSGRVYKADNDATSVDNFHVVGLVKIGGSSATAGTSVSITKIGKMPATGHGFTVGQPIWLSTSGALTSTAPTTASSAAVKVGMAEDANTIDVLIQILGVN